MSQRRRTPSGLIKDRLSKLSRSEINNVLRGHLVVLRTIVEEIRTADSDDARFALKKELDVLRETIKAAMERMDVST